MFKTSIRHAPKFSLKGKLKQPDAGVHPTSPARTRFAPSPTGFLHLGSLRTALYNYLLAKSTGGQFLLRLEDTDQKRLVPGAEQNIYDSLRWTGLTVDEGPEQGGPYGPYRQSDRMQIYDEYVRKLLASGHAYVCSCSKHRLDDLRASATKLKPPTTVTYDRKCFHHESHTDYKGKIVRFKSPDTYKPFRDLVHGELNLQPQYNAEDRRFDDFVIMKSDGLPTYHFANVVDDHLMKITHVIRGEEWLSLTPKHIALYEAFGWTPPSYTHIPLLTSLEDKKLSKRQGDIGILSMKEKGILPEALTNFCALFGWSPPRADKVSTSEVMTLAELEARFSLNNLTKGNAKVNDNKLHYFNKHHLHARLGDESRFAQLVDENLAWFQEISGLSDRAYFEKVLRILGKSLSSVRDLETVHGYIFKGVDYSQASAPANAKAILEALDTDNLTASLDQLTNSFKKKDVFQLVRYALSGGVAGATIPVLVELLGPEECRQRVEKAIKHL